MISWKGIWQRSTLVKGSTVFTSGSPTIDREWSVNEKKANLTGQETCMYFCLLCNNFKIFFRTIMK